MESTRIQLRDVPATLMPTLLTATAGAGSNTVLGDASTVGPGILVLNGTDGAGGLYELWSGENVLHNTHNAMLALDLTIINADHEIAVGWYDRAGSGAGGCAMLRVVFNGGVWKFSANFDGVDHFFTTVTPIAGKFRVWVQMVPGRIPVITIEDLTNALREQKAHAALTSCPYQLYYAVASTGAGAARSIYIQTRQILVET